MTSVTKKRTRTDEEDDNRVPVKADKEVKDLASDLKKRIGRLHTGLGFLATDVRNAQGLAALLTEKVECAEKIEEDEATRSLNVVRQQLIIGHFAPMSNTRYVPCCVANCYAPTNDIRIGKRCRCGSPFVCRACLQYLLATSGGKLQCGQCNNRLDFNDLELVNSTHNEKSAKTK